MSTQASQPAVDIRGLTRAFGSRKALRSVQFTLPSGASLVVLGPNGAGKTTLLRTIALLDKPSSGTVSVFGMEAAEHADDIRMRLGFISHAPMLYLDLSAEENLLFYARLYGVQDAPSRVRSLLDLVELSHRRSDQVRGFSRGMLQRMAIARALVHDPDLLLLDEPYTGLDPHALGVVERVLEEGQGRTLVTVSHDLERGLEAASHVLLLAAGRQVLFGHCDGLGVDCIRESYAALLGRR